MRLIATSIVFAASGIMYGMVAQSDRRMHSSDVIGFPTACVVITGLAFFLVLGLSFKRGEPEE